MRNSIKTALAGAILSLFGFGQVAGAMAAGESYTVVNTNSTSAIQQVWAAHAGETDPWTPAGMDYAIAPGTSSNFTIRAGGNCLFDIKVRFSDGAEQTFDNVNVCRGDRVIAT